MDTTQEIGMTTEMTNVQTLLDATERLEAAETAVRGAEIHLTTLVPGVPLRYGVEATRRLRAARAELEVARVAYEAAQDLPAPED
jgi:hypothetical protein